MRRPGRQEKGVELQKLGLRQSVGGKVADEVLYKSKYFLYGACELGRDIAVSADALTTKSDGGPAVSLWTLKAAALWLTLIIASVAASQLGFRGTPVPLQAGPLSGLQALLVVNGATAVALSLLAQRAHVAGWRLAVLIFVALYGIQSFMMIIDGLWFNDTLGMSIAAYAAWGLNSAIIAAVAGVVAALLFRHAPEAVAAVPSGIFWRLVALTVVYVFLYFGAGSWAWQHEVLRNYYANMHVSFGPLLALQFVRGFLWAVISLFVVARIRGTLWSRVLVMTVLFGILTTAQLLCPNPVMPWAIRQIHMVEVGVSEALYAAIAVFVLLTGAARRPLANASRWRVLTGRA